MAPDIPVIPRSDIQNLIGELIHAGRSAAQANLYAVDWHGFPAILKDFSIRPPLIRWTWGRLIIAREYRALRRLYGVEGIPKLLARVGPYAILMERLNADRIPRRSETPPPPEFFERASRLLRSLHDMGIGHGDLRRKNILIDAQARPYLIDFATTIASKGGAGGLPSRALFRHCAAIDRFQLAQMKADFYPDGLTSAERASLENPPWYLRAGQIFKRRIYRYRKSRHRRRLFKRLFHRKPKQKD